MSKREDKVSVSGKAAAGPFHAVDDYQARLKRIALISRITDTAIRVPGTDVKLGLDAVIGAVPLAGDMVMLCVSAVLIRDAQKLGVPRHALLQMAANSGIDAVIGSVPFIGDLFDLVYRANERNMRIVEQHIGRVDAPVIEVPAKSQSGRESQSGRR
jgi:Domain of unknown function (DUF4112)